MRRFPHRTVSSKTKSLKKISQAHHSVPEIIESVVEVINEKTGSPMVGLTLHLKPPNQPIRTHRTNSEGRVNIPNLDAVSGQIEVLSIEDQREEPWIRYNRYHPVPFITNQSHIIIKIPDKRTTIERISRTLNIVRRAQWGARQIDDAKMEEDWDFNTIVLHDSGNRGEKNPKKIQDLHLDHKHWNDIAYQYLIGEDGKIYEGRYFTHKSAANSEKNTGKIGILLTGHFEPEWWDIDDNPTSEQLRSTIKLIKVLKAEFPTIATFGGHRDFGDTECPGDSFYPYLTWLRFETGLEKP